MAIEESGGDNKNITVATILRKQITLTLSCSAKQNGGNGETDVRLMVYWRMCSECIINYSNYMADLISGNEQSICKAHHILLYIATSVGYMYDFNHLY